MSILETFGIMSKLGYHTGDNATSNSTCLESMERRLKENLNVSWRPFLMDIGSDLDLVNTAFAKPRAYDVEPAFEQVEFADYSAGCTYGLIKISFVVGNANSLGFHLTGGETRSTDHFASTPATLTSIADRTGDNISAAVIEVLEEYDLISHNKVGYFVLNNASNKGWAINELGRKLQWRDPSNRRIRCFVHILHLVTKAMLFVNDDNALEDRVPHNFH
ncbi:hypothetical protein LZL87_013697 [Fusarium oxysporum]|nr:hypothetical protein LZL87_013697 [Fusarium oxysporum]